jgi:hypothetical protein
MRILLVEPITPQQTLERVMRISPASAVRFTPRSNEELTSASAPLSMSKHSPAQEIQTEENEMPHLVDVWA